MENVFGSTVAGIIIIILLIIVAILLFFTFRMNARISELSRKYRALSRRGATATADGEENLAGSKNAGSIANLDKLANRAGEQRQQIKSLRNQYDRTLSKYGVVKYDAFEDVGGKLSFALAMLDNENSGFVLDAIHSRDNCFMYLKEIVKGESYIMLSEEETEALRRAADSRDEDLL